MKIAVCYSGTLGGKVFKDNIGGIIPVEESFQYFKDKIIKSNPECNFDFFIHSWSTSHEKEIINTIKPVKSIIESQIDFHKEALSESKLIFDFKDIRPYISLIIRKFFAKSNYDSLIKERIAYKFRIYSRWYSSKKAVELKRTHEIENNFNYDYVFLTRFDIIWQNYLKFKDLKKNFFYSSNWYTKSFFSLRNKNFDNRNFSDYWFVCDSKMMDIFATLYDFLPEYYPCSHRATYQHAKKIFGKKNLSYILELEKDYEIYRRVIK